ncbi:type III secretion protein [Pseudomonas sp. CFBP 8770]|uniref:type III secretion protein n=1 Tax=unclassified Pseudomonas TaxID=196821 RepID=UPI00177C8E6E|nr:MULTISPECIES: type III secretion protein [unclassified Pseudomonas]MBD8472950.1 type III secretion protein [Pseudomonas sp. CFBP 8773]MBD8645947.1 type III secretion protein [Pseudomonas sp. CFBP 8770]
MSQHGPDITARSSQRLRSTPGLPCALLILAMLAGPDACASAAATLAWTAQPYPYLIIDQDVRGVLQEMGSNLGFAVVISDAVKGKVRGKVAGDSAADFLAALSTANGLGWYFDGSTLFVDSANDTAARTFDTGTLSAAAVQGALAPLLAGGPRARLSVDASARRVSAAGAPGYLSLIDEQLAALRPPLRHTAASQPAARSVRIFRGGAETQVVSGLD